jgi:hypothetical protein
VASSANPFLRHRFADLVWDLSKLVQGETRDRRFAKVAIDAAIETLNADILEVEVEGLVIAERAVELARSIGDRGRQRSAEQAFIAYEQKHAQDHLAGTWGRAFDALLLKGAHSHFIRPLSLLLTSNLKCAPDRLKRRSAFGTGR